MKTAVIVQARMGSSRFPSKVMYRLGAKTVLRQVLERCSVIPGADVVVCAVPREPASKPLVAEAQHCGVAVFHGSDTDVLARYVGAARAIEADIVMRVTSDCPLIDPDVCGEVLALRTRGAADYAANNLYHTFPHGLDCEAFTMAALLEAEASAVEPYDREHVTPWLRRAPHLRRVNLEAAVPRLAGERWTLDYPEDLAFLQAVFDALPSSSSGRMADILAVLEAQPALRRINAMRHTTVTG